MDGDRILSDPISRPDLLKMAQKMSIIGKPYLGNPIPVSDLRLLDRIPGFRISDTDISGTDTDIGNPTADSDSQPKVSI
jgi:hypothetical protein